MYNGSIPRNHLTDKYVTTDISYGRLCLLLSPPLYFTTLILIIIKKATTISNIFGPIVVEIRRIDLLLLILEDFYFY